MLCWVQESHGDLWGGGVSLCQLLQLYPDFLEDLDGVGTTQPIFLSFYLCEGNIEDSTIFIFLGYMSLNTEINKADKFCR